MHGVFDLIHLGHLYYFQEAKSYGDILIVSVTSDRYVKKGLNKPYFKQNERLSFLNHLSLVDYVFCNDKKDVSDLILHTSPDFYVKGPDYKKKNGDEAGNLSVELNAINKVNGKFITTSNIQFSSTNLINRGLIYKNSKENNWLDEIKKESQKKNLIKEFNTVLNKVRNQKILIIGEIIFDEYNFVEPLGKPSKENILSVNFKKKELYFGGSIPVVKNLSSICKNLTVLSVYNKKSNFDKIKKFFLKDKIKLKLFKKNDFKDIYKSRYLNYKSTSKIFEVYNFLNKDFFDYKIYKYLEKNLKLFDKVIVCDFGHGLINQKIAELLSKKSKFLCANIQTNSGNRGFNLFTKYKKLDFLSLDEPELRLGLKDNFSNINNLINKLSKKHYKNIMITRGVDGLNFKNSRNFNYIPALSLNPVDTIGAGDSAFSYSSAFINNTQNSTLISLVAAISGAIKVQILGHKEPVNSDDVFKTLRSLLK